MKKLILILTAIMVSYLGKSQIDIRGKVKDKVNQRVEQKVDEGIDKGLDETEAAAKESAKKKEKDSKAKTTDSNSKENTTETQNSENKNTASKPGPSSGKDDIKSFSKYDFIPGDKVIFYEDFTQDAIGDFPVNWNTNGSGEVVTLSSFDGRWLKWSAGVSYSPNLSTPFPDNFTLEYDLLMQKPEGKEDPYFGLTIYSSDKDLVNSDGVAIGTAAMQLITQSSWDVVGWNGTDAEPIGSSAQVSNSNYYNQKVHISIWGQRQRMRVYVNEIKVLDLPKAFPANAKLNRVKFSNNPGLNFSNDDAGPIFMSNVRVAIGATDMRSKLITDGKLVTHGILFDVNSDKIKGESYGTLKEIAQVLKDNPTVKVKIVGHTDSDGDDQSNLDLSKRRAASVKSSLSKDFGVDASRMLTDGKGESEPSAPNTTPEGKANNRRVEFLKL
ncbi:MAG: OmpA family protein [Bacteroidetes bacterium]|nr:OmpA family protein [Bacteroidota bacterium]